MKRLRVVVGTCQIGASMEKFPMEVVVLVQKRGVLKSVIRGSSDFILGLERFNHTREPFQMVGQRGLQHLI